MNLVIIVGPGAVGKMTVGQELAKLTNYCLLHNHATIELVLDVFKEFHSETILKLRDCLLDQFLKTNNTGLIMTMIWAFDEQEDWNIIHSYVDKWQGHGEVYFVELEAPQPERLIRNKTPNRLLHKPSKRNITASEEMLLRLDSKYRQNSKEGEIPYPNYLRVNNEKMSALETAGYIKKYFSL